MHRAMLIVPAEKWPWFKATGYGAEPFWFVSRTGYVPYSTKTEILRRYHPDLIVWGSRKDISEWVVYVLRTLTRGRIFFLFPA